MNLKTMALKIGLAGVILAGGTAAALAASAQATTALNVRLGPGTQYGIVDQLYAGERVEVLGCRGSWCEITHRGPDGWVSAKYLRRAGGYYDDDYDVRPAPRYYPYHPRPRYWDYGRRSYATFCFGGPNARICFTD